MQGETSKILAHSSARVLVGPGTSRHQLATNLSQHDTLMSKIRARTRLFFSESGGMVMSDAMNEAIAMANRKAMAN